MILVVVSGQLGGPIHEKPSDKSFSSALHPRERSHMNTKRHSGEDLTKPIPHLAATHLKFQGGFDKFSSI